MLACEETGISVTMMSAGSRVRACSALRKELVVEFVQELGLSYAAAARLLGISASGVNQVLLRIGLL